MSRLSCLFKVSVCIEIICIIVVFFVGGIVRYLTIYGGQDNTIPVRPYSGDAGYILSVHYSDQLTGSIGNLFSLQCWASTLQAKVKVVEPFIHYGSILGVSLNPSPNKINNTILVTDDNEEVYMTDDENVVKLSDIIDEQSWLQHSTTYSPLVSWEYFLGNAPKQVILVDMSCRDKSLACMQCQNEYSQSILFHEAAKKFVKLNGLEIVREICYNPHIYDPESFTELVYNKYNPEDMVVIFNHWGGIHTDSFMYRIPINLRECDRGHLFHFILPSNRIKQNSALYVEKYIPEGRKKGYIGVMVRMEHFAINMYLKYETKEQQLSRMIACMNSISYEVERLKKQSGISSVFLTTDVGKYGSIYLRKSSNSRINQDVLTVSVQHLYNIIFGSSTVMVDHTERIESVASFKNPGYVAILQRNIAASGNCLIMGGGGVFQEHASQLYVHYHSKLPDCVNIIDNC